jgi:hypothetical protein
VDAVQFYDASAGGRAKDRPGSLRSWNEPMSTQLSNNCKGLKPPAAYCLEAGGMSRGREALLEHGADVNIRDSRSDPMAYQVAKSERLTENAQLFC